MTGVYVAVETVARRPGQRLAAGIGPQRRVPDEVLLGVGRDQPHRAARSQHAEALAQQRVADGERHVLDAVLAEDPRERGVGERESVGEVPTEVDARPPQVVEVDEVRARVRSAPDVEVLAVAAGGVSRPATSGCAAPGDTPMRATRLTRRSRALSNELPVRAPAVSVTGRYPGAVAGRPRPPRPTFTRWRTRTSPRGCARCTRRARGRRPRRARRGRGCSAARRRCRARMRHVGPAAQAAPRELRRRVPDREADGAARDRERLGLVDRERASPRRSGTTAISEQEHAAERAARRCRSRARPRARRRRCTDVDRRRRCGAAGCRGTRTGPT